MNETIDNLAYRNNHNNHNTNTIHQYNIEKMTPPLGSKAMAQPQALANSADLTLELLWKIMANGLSPNTDHVRIRRYGTSAGSMEWVAEYVLHPETHRLNKSFYSWVKQLMALDS